MKKPTTVLSNTQSFVMICTKYLRYFLLYSSSLVEIRNIRSPLVFFLEFEQSYIEQLDPFDHLQNNKTSGSKNSCWNDLFTFYPLRTWIGFNITRFSTFAWKFFLLFLLLFNFFIFVFLLFLSTKVVVLQKSVH